MRHIGCGGEQEDLGIEFLSFRFSQPKCSNRNARKSEGLMAERHCCVPRGHTGSQLCKREWGRGLHRSAQGMRPEQAEFELHLENGHYLDRKRKKGRPEVRCWPQALRVGVQRLGNGIVPSRF